jgi:type III secretion protein J
VRLNASAPRSTRFAPAYVLALGLASAALVGCSTEIVVHGVGEREANRIVEVLSNEDINANKITNASGREIVYDISVSASQRIDAIKTLNEHELPRRRDRGYSEVFGESGLIPTSSEEKAKRLEALEGEIERQLKLIDGVLDVEVQIVMPDESALRTTKEQESPTTASVALKYLPRTDGSKPVTEAEVQAVVAAGVERLMPENVVVLMRRIDVQAQPDKKSAAIAFGTRVSSKVMSSIIIGVGSLVVFLLIVVIFSQWQLRTVRGRLMRLQAEIAKARKKPAEALQTATPGTAA